MLRVSHLEACAAARYEDGVQKLWPRDGVSGGALVKRIVVGPRPPKDDEEALVAWRARDRARQRQRKALRSAKTKRQQDIVVRQLDGKRPPIKNSTRKKMRANAKRQHAEGRTPGRKALPEASRRSECIQYRVTDFQREVLNVRLERADAKRKRRAGSWLRETALGYETAWPLVHAVPLPDGWATREAAFMEYHDGYAIRMMVTRAEKAELIARARAAGYEGMSGYVRDIHLARDRENTTSTTPLRQVEARAHEHVVEAHFIPRDPNGPLTHR